ncbi:MAG: hypothetical protein ACI86H_000864 [bacterium]|jgi:hypothetical protein
MLQSYLSELDELEVKLGLVELQLLRLKLFELELELFII